MGRSNFSLEILKYGRKLKVFRTNGVIQLSLILPVSKMSTMTLAGSATPTTSASGTSPLPSGPVHTMFFAT